MSDGETFRPGDFYRTDDRTGRKVRASDTRKEWTGRIVDKDWWEARQPQDFVRGLADRQTVPNPRPDVLPNFVGPLTTTMAVDAPAGTVILTVASSVRFSALDYVLVSLDNKDTFRARLLEVTDAEHVTLVQALPWAASIGNLIVNMSVTSPARL